MLTLELLALAPAEELVRPIGGVSRLFVVHRVSHPWIGRSLRFLSGIDPQGLLPLRGFRICGARPVRRIRTG
jgi:hypothetical protein